MDIRPSSDLRNKYSEVSNQCKESKEPIYITVNGREDTVLLSIAEFKRMKAELELLRMLSEAEEDVREGNVKNIEDVFTPLKKKLGVE